MGNCNICCGIPLVVYLRGLTGSFSVVNSQRIIKLNVAYQCRSVCLDRELDSPTATEAPATALGMVVPGTGVTAPASTTPSPPEAPDLKKYPMSYLPAHPDWFLCLTCKGGRHRMQELQCMKSMVSWRRGLQSTKQFILSAFNQYEDLILLMSELNDCLYYTVLQCAYCDWAIK